MMTPSLRPTSKLVGPQDTCTACFFQRNANLLYILRRAIHESGPDENQTFGHCFVCVRCPQPGNGEPIPYCRGWWPSDPSGGDYEGDGGVIQADHDEQWHKADCISIPKEKALALRSYIYGYGQHNDYQVINQGGRSCLGYCTDVANVLDFKTVHAWGNYTIPGDMQIPTAQWHQSRRTELLPSEFTNQIWTIQMTGN